MLGGIWYQASKPEEKIRTHHLIMWNVRFLHSNVDELVALASVGILSIQLTTLTPKSKTVHVYLHLIQADQGEQK